MEFRIADTFTDSLARLTADEQKAIKTTAFDLQTLATPARRVVTPGRGAAAWLAQGFMACRGGSTRRCPKSI